MALAHNYIHTDDLKVETDRGPSNRPAVGNTWMHPLITHTKLEEFICILYAFYSFVYIVLVPVPLSNTYDLSSFMV